MQRMQRVVQRAQAKALMESAYFQALLDIIEEMKRQVNENGTIGNNEFETICLSVRRQERLLTLQELIDNIGKYASEAKI